MKVLIKRLSIDGKKAKLMAVALSVKTPVGLRKFKLRQDSKEYTGFPARVSTKDLNIRFHNGKIVSVVCNGYGQFPHPKILGEVSEKATFVEDGKEYEVRSYEHIEFCDGYAPTANSRCNQCDSIRPCGGDCQNILFRETRYKVKCLCCGDFK